MHPHSSLKDAQRLIVLTSKGAAGLPLKVNNWIQNFRGGDEAKNASFDVVDFSWFLRCIQQSRLLPLKSKDVYYATQATRRLVDEVADQYGDPYVEHATRNSLIEVGG